MKPIKNLISALSGVAIGLALAENVMAYEIGDRVPDFTQMRKVWEVPWYHQPASKKGVMRFYSKNRDNAKDYVVHYLICGNKELLYAFFDNNENILYTDNDPSDGKIDGKTRGFKGKNIVNTSPSCPASILSPLSRFLKSLLR